jgi:ubiquinone/menaquinone biosynthesis C-methylase UbiE
MRKNAVDLEEQRLADVHKLEDYQAIHERHRIFPQIFEQRKHHRILDISAGVGIVAQRIKEGYSPDNGEVEMICNDVSPTCVKLLRETGQNAVSFDIDDGANSYPFPDSAFDAIISLATIEHLVNMEHFLTEIRRLLDPKGFLYISAPNYSGLPYLVPFLITGKTFHDPMKEKDKYEFHAHVKYFTYRTLCEVVSSFGYELEAVYIGLPESGTRYKDLCARSKMRGMVFRSFMSFVYRFFSPRWASEPVLCFRKSDSKTSDHKPRKVIL